MRATILSGQRARARLLVNLDWTLEAKCPMRIAWTTARKVATRDTGARARADSCFSVGPIAQGGFGWPVPLLRRVREQIL